MTMRAVVRGVGHYLPSRVVENSEFEDKLDTSDEWIRARTGIERRHFAAEGETTSDMGAAAGRAAIADAGLTAEDIDAIIVATSTADLTFPAAATMVQQKIGMTKGFAFDVQAVCSGFLFALATADSLLKQGLFNTAVVIGAETFTRILDWSDRSTCVLFGDGGGAVVLKAEDWTGDPLSGVIAHHVRTDGTKSDLLYVDGGVSSTGTIGHVRMEGNRVFRHAVANISSAIQAIYDETGLTGEDIDWFVPHQANKRILDGVAKKMDISEDKVIVTVDEHANTSAGSIPLALNHAVRSGRAKKGDLILSEAMGGGFSWGASLFRL